MHLRILGRTIAFILVFSSGNSDAQDVAETANYGEIELRSGFRNDPHVVRIAAGGSTNLSSSTFISNCVGWVSTSPDYQITYERSSDSALSLGFYTESTADTTLLINDPSGNWHCNDDFSSELGLTAGILFENPNRGVYDIWVGVYDSDDRFESAELFITELNDALNSGLPEGNSSGPPDSSRGGSGTGFAVSRAGHIVTNHHVVDTCDAVTFKLLGLPEYRAEIIATNTQFDLALLKIESSEAIAKFAPNQSLRLGDEIVVYGFPLVGELSSQGNLTNGVVSALTGLDDDLATFQMNAQIQPGNSGGPVISRTGAIVGTVVSMANEEYFTRQSGMSPQNVNFAIKADIVRSFLDANNIGYELLNDAQITTMSIADIAEVAQTYTGTVSCQIEARGSTDTDIPPLEDPLEIFSGLEGDTIEEVVTAMNNLLPIDVDDETRFDSVYLSDDMIIYTYTLVNFERDDLIVSEFNAILRPTLESNTCENDDMDIFREKQMPLSYSYNDRNGEPISTITINPTDCR